MRMTLNNKFRTTQVVIRKRTGLPVVIKNIHEERDHLDNVLYDVQPEGCGGFTVVESELRGLSAEEAGVIK